MSKAELLRTASPIRFIREPELLVRTGLSATAIDLLEAAGEFPRRVPVSAHVVAWVEAEIEAWQRDRIAARDDMARSAKLKLLRSPPPARQRMQARREREHEHEADTAGPI
jgi:prophage regulatory protein